MLFNSYEYLFLFLPVVLGTFFCLGCLSDRRYAIAWLVIASLAFYGYWRPPYLALILTSMVFNFLLGRHIALTQGRSVAVLALGISFNLAALGYFKYANFFVENVAVLTGNNWSIETVVLPLAISFFTFQQISFLVDCHRKLVAEYRFLDYALFVSFFPQLIAGPIVHHKEMLPQFQLPETYRPQLRNISVGLTFLAIGLFKKVVLADSLAQYSTRVFDAADAGREIWMLEAWAGALAYTFQLYFDFSGYVDMAMGSARLFGIRLPVNFYSPYKSVNIVEFWRRWHMTLSRFLRDYLYISLGGNRHGRTRRYLNLSITMVLGGLWHGASWNFVIWGALHGIYLVINHAWIAIKELFGWQHSGRMGQALAWFITFLAVVFAWVLFRAETLDGAWIMLSSMSGSNFLSFPDAFSGRLGGVAPVLAQLGVVMDGQLILRAQEWVNGIGLLIASFFIVLLLPNTNEILDETSARGRTWQPTFFWGAVTSFAFIAGILSLSRVSEFLYFNF